jgi:hypothetical protein
VVYCSPTVSLRIAHPTPAIQKHICEQMQWEVSTLKAVHWVSYYRAFKKQDVNSQTRLLKYIYGWLPVGHIRQHIDPDKPDFCPSCRVCDKTSSHIMLCCEQENCLNLYISKFPKSECTLKNARHTVLSQTHSSPVFADGTKTHNNYHHRLTTVSRSLQKAVTDQNNIGWGGLYSGHISIDYQTAHNREQEPTL